MAKQPTEHRMDERLAELLALEQDLEARTRQRAAAARAKVEEARAALVASQTGVLPDLEEAAAAEAQADQAAHAAALAQLAAEHQAALARLEQVDAGVIDRLARHALGRAVEPTGGPR